MAKKAVAAAPQAISDQSAKTRIADRPIETQTVVDTRHADITTTGNAPSVAGESQQDAGHISPASPDNTQSVAPDTASEIATTKPISDAAPARPEDDLGSVPSADAGGKERDSATHPSDQSAQPLTPELFPIDDYGAYTAEKLHNTNLHNYREGERLFGKFTAHLYDRVLPAINESIKRLKDGTEINGFSGERQVGAYLESVGYTADLVRQWNKRYRDRMAKLKEALGLPDGNANAKLTAEQRELRETLMQQGYKNPEATRLAKAAEGNSVGERFNWVMAHKATEINGTGTQKDVTGAISTVTEVPNSAPANEASEPAPAGESVTSVTHVDALPQVPGDSVADKLRETLANEPDRDVASKMLTDYLHRVAEQFASDRIQIKEVSATVEFAGRDHRIVVGDWLEKRDETAGTTTLCKCVGVADFMQRRRVREWTGGEWGRERVVFSDHEHHYRVITEAQAHLLVPDAFPPVVDAEPAEGL